MIMKVCVELKNGNKIITEIKTEDFQQFIVKELFNKQSEWLINEDLMLRFEDVSSVHRYKDVTLNKPYVKFNNASELVDEIDRIIKNMENKL